jgi:single-strand DNA-binding protein
VAGYNRIIMIGNLTRDPDLKQLQSGQSVCRLNIASNRQFKNRQGSLTQEVCFIDVDVWGPQADSCNQYLKKGRPVLVEGRLKLDSWKETDGQARSKHSIVADRVVFLASAQGAEVGGEMAEDVGEPAMLAQRRNSMGTSTRMEAAQPSLGQPTAVGGSAQFKDEPPFADDLPF